MLKLVQHCFSVGPPVQGDFFVDRTEIVRRATELLSTSSGNLLIIGARRVGKTSLCFKLCERASSIEHIIAAYMSMEANYEQSQDRFTQGVLLHTIKSIALSVFEKTYSQLLADLGKPRGLNTDYGKLLRLFELARQNSGSAGHSRHKEVGASLMAHTSLSEEERHDLVVGQFSSFEYLAILDEVVDFLRQHNISRFVLFVDEANKLTLEANSRVIRENLALFSSKGMQFCFVTTPEVVAAVPAAGELFHHRINIGAFDDKESVHRLVERCCLISGVPVRSPQVFSPDAIDAIWRVSKGLPFRVQSLCQKSLTLATDSDREIVKIEDVLDAVSELD